MPALPSLVEQAPQSPPADAQRVLFRFVQVSDTHITDEASVYLLERAVDQINAARPRPDFVVFTGDLANDSTPAQLALFKQTASRLRMPWYPVVGNHDMGNGGQDFEQVLGPRNRSFDVGPVTCIILDSTMDTDVTFGGGFREEVLKWLEDTLSALPAEKPLIIFCHHLFYSADPYKPRENLLCDVVNPEAIQALLKGRKVLGVFAGHSHTNTETKSGDTIYVTTAALSLTRGNSDKSNAGFREVTVYPDRLESRYWAVGEKPRTGEAVCAVVTQQPGTPFSGASHEPVQAAIDWVAERGGGLVLVTEGTYTVGQRILLRSGVRLVGKGAALVLPPVPLVRTSQPAAKGEKLLRVEGVTSGFMTGKGVEIHVPHENRPVFYRGLEATEEGVMKLSGELPVDVPAGTPILQAWNMLEAQNSAEVIGLRLIGNREQSFRPHDHCTHCGIIATGYYPYDNRGPGQPIEHLRIVDCEITGFHHRGIALYNVAYATVSWCRITGCGAEVIDFDHYCHDCVATGNHLEDRPVGVECNDTWDCSITGNRVVRCRVGVNIWEWFPSPVVNSDNLVAWNVFDQCTTGIHCGKGSEYNYVAANEFISTRERDVAFGGTPNAFAGNKVSDRFDATGLPQGSVAVENERK